MVRPARPVTRRVVAVLSGGECLAVYPNKKRLDLQSEIAPLGLNREIRERRLLKPGFHNDERTGDRKN
jgi:hypothetical protein